MCALITFSSLVTICFVYLRHVKPIKRQNACKLLKTKGPEEKHHEKDKQKAKDERKPPSTKTCKLETKQNNTTFNK